MTYKPETKKQKRMQSHRAAKARKNIFGKMIVAK